MVPDNKEKDELVNKEEEDEEEYNEKQYPKSPLEQPIEAYYEYNEYQDDFYHHRYEY